jgi:uncharacterized protein
VARDESGRYILKFGPDWAVITVDDAPIHVNRACISKDSVVLRLSDGTEERLDPTTLRISPPGILYCRVHGGTMPARFSRSAQFALGDRLSDRDGGYVLDIAGHPFRVAQDGC